jgi:hypothetical protein
MQLARLARLSYGAPPQNIATENKYIKLNSPVLGVARSKRYFNPPIKTDFRLDNPLV